MKIEFQLKNEHVLHSNKWSYNLENNRLVV